jgi:hypothetical protein
MKTAAELSQEALAGCPGCNGAGFTVETKSAHDPNCDGSCVSCPVAIYEQAQCECGRAQLQEW